MRVDLKRVAARRVRLLVDREGRMDIGDEAIENKSGSDAKAVRVHISRDRTDAQDRMLYHKTTQKELYQRPSMMP